MARDRCVLNHKQKDKQEVLGTNVVDRIIVSEVIGPAKVYSGMWLLCFR